jgi:hypothetical protein
MSHAILPLEASVAAKIAELDHVASTMPMLMDGLCIARFAELSMELLQIQAMIAFSVEPEAEVDAMVLQIAVALEKAADQLYARKNSRKHLAAQSQPLESTMYRTPLKRFVIDAGIFLMLISGMLVGAKF